VNKSEQARIIHGRGCTKSGDDAWMQQLFSLPRLSCFLLQQSFPLVDHNYNLLHQGRRLTSYDSLISFIASFLSFACALIDSGDRSTRCHAPSRLWTSLIRSDPGLTRRASPTTTVSHNDLHNPDILLSICLNEHLMPSHHGVQFQLVAADGRCGLLQKSSGNAHNCPQ
jgi:hypothetical protein